MTIKVCKTKFENNMILGLKIFFNGVILGICGAFFYGLIIGDIVLIVLMGLFGGFFSLFWIVNDCNSFWLGYIQKRFKMFAWNEDC